MEIPTLFYSQSEYNIGIANMIDCVLSIGVMHEQLNAVAVPIRSLKSGKVYGLSASGLATEWPRAKLLDVGAELTALAEELAVVAD